MPLEDLPSVFHRVAGSDRGFPVSLLSRLLPFYPALPLLTLVCLPLPFWCKRFGNRGQIHRFHQAVIIFFADNDCISRLCADIHRLIILDSLLQKAKNVFAKICDIGIQHIVHLFICT